MSQDIRKFLKRKAPDDVATSSHSTTPGSQPSILSNSESQPSNSPVSESTLTNSTSSNDSVSISRPNVDVIRIPVRLPQEHLRKGHFSDIGNFIGRKLTQDERYRVLTSSWQPGSDYKFEPVLQANRLRHPQLKWLLQYRSLAFSDIEQGFFCKPCVAFSDIPFTSTVRNSKNIPKHFVSLPYRRFKDLLEDWKTHENTKYHKDLLGVSLDFQTNYTQSIDVHSLHISGHRKQLETNRKLLLVLIQVLYFLSKFELPFRGHVDHGRIREKCESSEGIFAGMVSFLIAQGHEDAKLLLNCPKNATYTSPDIQNQLLSCIASVMIEPVVKRIVDTGMFTLMLDETSSYSTEYLSIVLRSVDCECNIQEDFLGFLELENQSAKMIFDTAETRLVSLGISLLKAVAQGYDGAANLTGLYAGVQALVREINPEAIFFHCANHKLNLVASDAIKACHPDVMLVLSHFSNIVTHFHRSTKAAMKLEKIANTFETLPSKRRHLPSICDTRWVERHEALIAFKLMMPAVFATLCELSEGGDSTADTYRTVLDSQFRTHAILILCEDISKVLKRPAELLQSSQIELIRAFDLIDEVAEVIKTRITGARFDDMFDEAVELAKTCACPVTVKKGRETISDYESVKGHFRSLFSDVYSVVLNEVKRRFGRTQSDVVVGLLSLVPGIDGDRRKIMIAAQHYSRFLPDPDSLSVELETFEKYVEKCEVKPDTILSTLKMFKGLKYSHPNIHTMLRIGATLPVSTASVERSFSALSRILTDLRSGMTTYRLSDLAQISYYATSDEPDYDKVLDKFKQMKNRRIEF